MCSSDLVVTTGMRPTSSEIIPYLIRSSSSTSANTLGKSWRNLEAKTLDHYEIGLSHTWDRLRADLTFFRDKGKNRYLIVPPPPPPPVYANLDDYTVRGVETTLKLPDRIKLQEEV